MKSRNDEHAHRGPVLKKFLASVLGLTLLASCSSNQAPTTEQVGLPSASVPSTVSVGGPAPVAGTAADTGEDPTSESAAPGDSTYQASSALQDTATLLEIPRYRGTVYESSDGRLWAGDATICIPIGKPLPTGKLGMIQQQQVTDEIVAEPCTMGWGHWGLTLYRDGFSGGPIDVDIPDLDMLGIDCAPHSNTDAESGNVCVAFGGRYSGGGQNALIYRIPETGTAQVTSEDLLEASAFYGFETNAADGSAMLIGYVYTGESDASAPSAFKTFTVTERGATPTGCSEFSAELGRPYPTEPQTGTCDY